VQGEIVTTVSDVYSLGILLYRLLTGESPYQFATHTADEIKRVICETDPRKPSAVKPLSADLDNIVLKAMMLDIHDAIQDLPGSTAARKLLVDRALQYLDSLAQESSGDPGLQRELAIAYEKVGLVQGDTSHGSLGDSTGALRSYQKALAIRRALTSAKEATTDDRLALARSLSVLGRFFHARGDHSAALDLNSQSIVVMEALRKAEPDNPTVLGQLQDAYDALGDTLSSNGPAGGLGRLAEASEIHRKAVELGQEQARLHPDDRGKRLWPTPSEPEISSRN
jgi:serine/threonine protein kinase